MAVTVGMEPKVNWSPAEVAETPPAVVTVTSTVPAACVGEVAVRLVALVTVTAVAGVVPKLTVEPAVKPEPVTVTRVAPATGPEVGAMAVTAGMAS